MKEKILIVLITLSIFSGIQISHVVSDDNENYLEFVKSFSVSDITFTVNFTLNSKFIFKDTQNKFSLDFTFDYNDEANPNITISNLHFNELRLIFYQTFSDDYSISRLIQIKNNHNFTIGENFGQRSEFISPFSDGTDIWIAIDINFDKYFSDSFEIFSSTFSIVTPKLFGPFTIRSSDILSQIDEFIILILLIPIIILIIGLIKRKRGSN